MNCPLCTEQKPPLFFTDTRRSYYRCQQCMLVFIPDEQIISETEEKAIYDLHQNFNHDSGYRNFLSRVAEPLSSLLPKNAKGLDFGCGPNPVLAKILTGKGFLVDYYDPFYFPELKKLSQSYDFITATEVMEHVKDPKSILQFFDSRLTKNGILSLMTKLVIDQEAFSRWHYKNDLTHIRFYSQETLEWIANKWSWKLELKEKDVIFFKKFNL